MLTVVNEWTDTRTTALMLVGMGAVVFFLPPDGAETDESDGFRAEARSLSEEVVRTKQVEDIFSLPAGFDCARDIDWPAALGHTVRAVRDAPVLRPDPRSDCEKRLHSTECRAHVVIVVIDSARLLTRRLGTPSFAPFSQRRENL